MRAMTSHSALPSLNPVASSSWSLNQRMAWVGRDPNDHVVLIPPLPQATQQWDEGWVESRDGSNDDGKGCPIS